MNEPLRHFATLLRARWRRVVWGVLLALLAATVALGLKPAEYRSTATLFVRTPGDVSRVQDGGDLFARARVDTYSALAGGGSVAARVVADLGLQISPDAMSRRIHAEPRPGTALLDITVEAPSAQEAQRATAVVVSELSETVRSLESTPDSLVPRAELIVVDPSGQPRRVVAGGVPVWPLLAAVALLGVVFGAVAAVLRPVVADPVDDREVQTALQSVPPEFEADATVPIRTVAVLEAADPRPMGNSGGPNSRLRWWGTDDLQ